MFHDVSILFMLYNMAVVCYNQMLGMYGFEAKREKERFTVVCPLCRQNLKISHFKLYGTEKCTKMRAARAARSFLPLLTNNITAFWRRPCRSRRRFLNSL